MPLLLTVRTDSQDEGLPCRSLSVQGLLPEFVATQSIAAIKQLPVLCDNQPAQLGDFFHIDGNPEDEQIECRGDFSRVHFLGPACNQEQSLSRGISADIQESR